MRIISQDKKTDINYDSIYIMMASLEHNSLLVCSDKIGGEQSIVLGTFKTEEKVLAAMEKIRNAYVRGNLICIIPQDE